MGQYRKAIFIGRADPDTGLEEYRRLAKRLKINLDVFTNRPNAAQLLPKYDIAFVSGYLAILEALSASTPVLAHYTNGIKKDYLFMAPFAKYIQVFSDFNRVKLKYDEDKVEAGQKWANSQTWDRLADLYERLWTK